MSEISKVLAFDFGASSGRAMLFTFDGEKVFNLFRDYPHALSEKEKQIFDSENPYWAEFFKDRK